MTTPSERENQGTQLEEILGVNVDYESIGSLNSGGTIFINIADMTESQADRFIDEVLIPIRTEAGLNIDNLPFSLDADGQGHIRMIPQGQDVIDALMANQEGIQERINQFLRENELIQPQSLNTPEIDNSQIIYSIDTNEISSPLSTTGVSGKSTHFIS